MKPLEAAASSLDLLHKTILSVARPPEPPDAATATAADWQDAARALAAREAEGLSYGGVPGCLWAGAMLTRPSTPRRLQGLPLNNQGSREAPSWRWGVAPVLYLGDPTPLRIPAELGETGAEIELLWRSAIWGCVPPESWERIQAGFRSWSQHMMGRAKSLWPLPGPTREIVDSVSNDLDRWLLFCLLASLYRGSNQPFEFRLEAWIDGMPAPIEASIADVLAGSPRLAVSRLRTREYLMHALGVRMQTPPLSSESAWQLVAETPAFFELTCQAAVRDLVRGPASESAPDDVIPLKKACQAVNRCEKTIRVYIEKDELRDYRAPGHARNAPILVSRREVEELFEAAP